MLSSDNGGRPTDGMDDHRPNGNLKHIKRQIWEGGPRVPLIVRWPGTVAAGLTSDKTVRLTDLMATLAAYFGSDLRENAAEDSVDLLPGLRGETRSQPIREAPAHHSVADTFALRHGDRKLVEGDADGDSRQGHNAAAAATNPPIKDPVPGEFQAFTYDLLDFNQENPLCRPYNLHEDPAESTDVAAEHPEKVTELRAVSESCRQSEGSVPARSRAHDGAPENGDEEDDLDRARPRRPLAVSPQPWTQEREWRNGESICLIADIS